MKRLTELVNLEKCLRNLKKTIQLPLNLVQLHLGILIKTHK
ncbi:Uncharacterised protein [Mycobacteroides abscessus subsp. abscessus]|nr:Uncharacterised protein [Mycobacteroides abscessus subsp. abscessus]SLB72954.1 Uncharacterised protein [Mycobacteroides abscessus subsp. massiliense]